MLAAALMIVAGLLLLDGPDRAVVLFRETYTCAFRVYSINERINHKSILLGPSGAPNLNPLPRPLVVAAQHRPAGPVRLDQGQLQLGAQHAELRLFRVDRREQLVGVGEPLVVGRRQVEGDGGGAELDRGLGLVDFLEVQRDVDGGGSLVEVVPVAISH